jgi:hypothetical protein
MIESVSGSGLANYQYLFTPEENGEYKFRIERLESGALQTASAIELMSLDCMETAQGPSIISYSAYAAANCDMHLNWSAIDQSADTYFILYVSVGNSTPVPLDTIPAHGGPGGDYSYTYIPDENGAHIFQLEVWNGPLLVASYSSGIITADCFDGPEVFFSVQPPVTFGAIAVNITSNMFLPAEILIVNTLTGTVSLEGTLSLSPGMNTFHYDLDDLPNTPGGVYQIVITFPGGTRYKTIIYFN